MQFTSALSKHNYRKMPHWKYPLLKACTFEVSPTFSIVPPIIHLPHIFLFCNLNILWQIKLFALFLITSGLPHNPNNEFSTLQLAPIINTFNFYTTVIRTWGVLIKYKILYFIVNTGTDWLTFYEAVLI
jgi:hypothetical protein